MMAFLLKQRRDPVTMLLDWSKDRVWKKRMKDVAHMDWLSVKAKYDRDVEKARPQRIKHWCPAHGWEYYDEGDQIGTDVGVGIHIPIDGELDDADSRILLALLKGIL